MNCRVCRRPIVDGEDYERQLAGFPSGSSAVTNYVHTACLKTSLAGAAGVRRGEAAPTPRVGRS